VASTAAVVFLGTPHRGSKDMANLGDVVRKVAGLVVDTSPFALDTLALKNSDLSRCQDLFSKIWREYDFRVKTFQEGQGLTGLKFFNEKVRTRTNAVRASLADAVSGRSRFLLISSGRERRCRNARRQPHGNVSLFQCRGLQLPQSRR